MSEQSPPNWEANQPIGREQFSPPEVEPRQERLDSLQREFYSTVNDYVSSGRPHDSRFGITLSGVFGRVMQEYVNKIPNVEKLVDRGAELAELIKIKSDLTDRLAIYYEMIYEQKPSQQSMKPGKTCGDLWPSTLLELFSIVGIRMPQFTSL